MKIIHCADLHLDAKMNTNLDVYKAKERQHELIATFSRMINYAVSNDVSAIIMAGDIFDSKMISATAKNAVALAIFDNPEITFYYMQGNHDTDTFLSGLEYIPDNLKTFDHEWVSYRVGNIVVSGLELGIENALIAADTLSLNEDDFNIVILHGQESEHATNDRAQTIALRNYQNKGIDYMALGHVHTYKEEKLDARGVYCYSGCLEGRGFDECGEHGFVLLDIDEETKKSQRTFIPFASRTLYTVSVDVSGLMTSVQMVDRVRETLQETRYLPTSLIKVVLTGEVPMERELNVGFITKQLEGMFYYLKIADETQIAINYDEYELEQSLKGEFVRKVKESELSEEEKRQIIYYGMCLLMGKEI